MITLHTRDAPQSAANKQINDFNQTQTYTMWYYTKKKLTKKICFFFGISTIYADDDNNTTNYLHISIKVRKYDARVLMCLYMRMRCARLRMAGRHRINIPLRDNDDDDDDCGGAVVVAHAWTNYYYYYCCCFSTSLLQSAYSNENS